MKKLEKVSWPTYYVGWPIRDFINILSEAVEKAWIKLKGGWYCEYCGKIHNRRVYKYNCLDANLDTATGSLRDISDEPGRFVCSLGRDAALHEGWKPKNITLGDKILSDLMTVGKVFNNRGI